MSLILSVSYVGLHFATYALAGRHFSALRTERGIFAYHVLSYGLALLAIGLTASIRPSGDTAVFALLLAGLHGLYSLSFLELWSLTQGSYSLQLLDQIEGCGRAVPATELKGAQAIGALKQQDRAAALERLGLFRAKGSLTALGRVVAGGMRAILWLSNSKPLN